MAEIRSFFPAWRVFIFGVDVTDDLMSCIINHSGAESRAPSTAEVELVNGGTRGQTREYATDRYVITEEDIAVLYGIEEELPTIRFPSFKEVLAEQNQFGSVGIDFAQPSADEVNLPSIEVTYETLINDPPLQELQDQFAASATTLTTQQRESALRRVLNDSLRKRFGSVFEAKQEAFRRRQTAREIYDNQRERAETRVAQRQDYLDRVVRERIRARVRDPIKQRVLEAKFNVRQQLQDRDGNPLQPNLAGKFRADTLGQLPQLNGQALRYPFQVGDSIFHSNDQVRIFWRDPVNPEAWYHMFAGFVSDYTDSVNANNERIVRIRMEDASRILRYARITTNPGFLDIDDIAVQTDAVTRTFNPDGFADLSIAEFLVTVVFGAEQAGTVAEAGTTPDQVRQVETFSNTRYGVNGPPTTSPLIKDAVGAYNFVQSFIAIFGPDETENTSLGLGELAERYPFMRVNNLGEYQALVDHRVYVSDLDNLGLDTPDAIQRVQQLKRQLPVRNGEVVIEEVVQLIGENPQLFPVDYGRLIFLVPGSLGPGVNLDLILKEIIGVNAQTTWRTRLGLIYDVIERIDFQFYCSPRGDLLCEMPLYDFQPDDFGDDDAVDLGEIDFNNVTYFFNDADRRRGPYGPQLRVAKRDTERWERAFIDENVRTQMLGIRSLIQGLPSAGTSADIGEPEPVNLYGLMPQFGVRSETVDPKGIIANEVAARLYANIQLNKINAEARTAKVEILPRVQACFPNRPYEFEERSYVATSRTISHRMTWGMNGDVTTDLDTKYVRGWSGQVVDGNPVYEPIGGFASQAFNYALRFGNISPSVRSTREDDT